MDIDGENTPSKTDSMSNSNALNGGSSSSSAKESADLQKEAQEKQSAADSSSNIDNQNEDNDVVMEDAAKNAGTEETPSNGAASATTNEEKKTESGVVAAAPPPPVLRGTLSYNDEPRQHLIRGMWNYENSNAFPAQKFELLRNLRDDEEDGMTLPKDGEFHGSFSLAYYSTRKGVQRERSKVIAESGVKIKFTKIEGSEANTDGNGPEYKVDGTGVNEYGIFHINGTAKPTPHGDGQYSIELRKRYDSAATAASGAAATAAGKKKGKKQKKSSKGGFVDESDPSTLPPPSVSYDKNVVCLRGKLTRGAEGDDSMGAIDPLLVASSENLIHKISGMWSSGLDLLLSDPENTRGLCNRFEYEHKSSSPNASFPVSGRYSGWFDLNNEQGGKTKINEKDITLRFRKNNAGYHNVEGKGSNAFGKYTITGTMTNENVVTIFRHFLPKKIKSSSASASSSSTSSRLPVTSAPPPLNAPGQTRTMSPAYGSSATSNANPLSLEDVVIPDGHDGGKPAEPLKPPELPTYSAVSRGVLRVNDDGSNSCQGKWAMTREHFTNGQTSNFTFRLESHHAEESASSNSENIGRPFPLDSDKYKGSFQLKKGGSRYQTIVDTQVVMKFRENTAGTYNVYGKGVNEIGIFHLTGTLIASGKTGGQVELYRVYPPELLAAPPAAAPATKSKSAKKSLPAGSNLPPHMAAKNFGNIGGGPSGSYSTMMPGPPRGAGASAAAGAFGSTTMSRRESTRVVKVPSRLEDENPDAQFSRIMDKCSVLLRIIREKDVEMGAFFSEPVDPIALNIPTYHQVIKEPMDLRTLNRRMEGNDVQSPEEFARLCRLIFENAVMFNVDPTHSVHQAARNLLILFNQKYRDIERQVANLRRDGGIQDDGKGKKGEKKRKRGGAGVGGQMDEESKSMKRRRLDEAHEMALANSQVMTSLIGAAPHPATNDAGVTRKEFNIMLGMIQKLQHQVVQTYTALAELSSDDPGSGGLVPSSYDVMGGAANGKAGGAATTKKKAKKKAEPPKAAVEKKKPQPQPQPVVPEDDSTPLTLQEQEFLTETIPELPPDNLHGVIQIIREAAKLTGEEDEIDLEIDQLDTSTQRKLLRYVTKYVKPKRQKKQPPKKTKPAAPATKKQARKPPASKEQSPAPDAAPEEKPKSDSFFSFGNEEDSDSESEGEIDEESETNATESAEPDGAKDFTLGGLGDDDEDEDDEDKDDADSDHGGATSWNISKLEEETEKKDGDVDDAWGAAREKAVAAKAREEDKKKREEKLKADAEQQKLQNLAQAVAHGEEIKAQRQAEEEEEARLQEENERKAEEERKKAREDARRQVQSVEQTVDFDAERDLMKQLEQNYLEKEMGGASPSSDFGF